MQDVCQPDQAAIRCGPSAKVTLPRLENALKFRYDDLVIQLNAHCGSGGGVLLIRPFFPPPESIQPAGKQV